MKKKTQKERLKRAGGGVTNSDLHLSEIDIVQTLVNLEPDVDAIYRLTRNKNPVDYLYMNDLLIMDKGIYTPGNTQSTFWLTKKSQDFLYVPVTVDFRFCDILKMYVAQSQNRFAYASFFTEQIRNQHDLMSDFKSEISCYLGVDKTVSQLRGISQGASLREIYVEMVNIGICQSRELEILDTYLSELDVIESKVSSE